MEKQRILRNSMNTQALRNIKEYNGIPRNTYQGISTTTRNAKEFNNTKGYQGILRNAKEY